MRTTLYPTGLALVGCLLICTFSVPGLANQPSIGIGPASTSKDPFIDFPCQQDDSWGILQSGDDAVFFPWYGPQSLTMPTKTERRSIRSSQSDSQDIQLNSSNSAAEVDDLTAVDCDRQRVLQFDASDPQIGDPELEGMVNDLEISVDGSEENNVEDNRTLDSKFPQNGVHHAGNFLSVVVEDISVTAINTMEGGSASATSNIIIEPVQIIVSPSEVNAKLA